jgi:hypothetical protein
MVFLNDELRAILGGSFAIRTTMTRRRSGTPRTMETTFHWDGKERVYLSGHPGRRDWVANMAQHPHVTLHTAEASASGLWYDIPATARVLRDRAVRMPHLLGFIERFTQWPGSGMRWLRLVVKLMRWNHQLRLPWWGPLYLARRVLDQMPCVELTLTGEPVARSRVAALSEPRGGR